MGCSASTSISVYRAPKKEEACTTFSRIDSTTSVPDDLFFELLRRGKEVRNNGSHMEVRIEGRRSLRRTDLWESETRLSQHSRRANALRPSDRSVTFQLPADVRKKMDEERTEYSCSTFAEGTTEASTLVDTERSLASASDFDDLSRQASTELSDVEVALSFVDPQLGSDEPPRAPRPSCVVGELGEGEIRVDEIVLGDRLATYS